MARILHVIASPRRDRSISRQLTTAFVEAFVLAHPGTAIDTLDLWADDALAFGPDHVDAKMAVIEGRAPTAAARAAWSEVVGAFERFDRADLYVIGAPMWNGGVPWVLKRYLDTITQPGLLFRFAPDSGYRGLLRRKHAVLAATSSVYRPGVDVAFGADFHSTYLRYWLQFAGIDSVDEIGMQPVSRHDPGFPARLDDALQTARALAHSVLPPVERGSRL